MQKLHLVGFTTDHRALILSARRGARSGGYVIELDDAATASITDALARRTAALDAEPEPEPGPVAPPAPRPESTLTVREVQTRLRAGRTVDDVAAEAGVEPAWVARFAPPVLAEQARVIEATKVAWFERSRLGRSGLPLGAAVYRNLVDRGVRTTADELDKGWSARQGADGRWLVTLTYSSRGRRQRPTWELAGPGGPVLAEDRLAVDLAFVAPDPAPAPPRPGKKPLVPVTAPTEGDRASARRVAAARKVAEAQLAEAVSVSTKRDMEVTRRAAARPAPAEPEAPAPARPTKAAAKAAATVATASGAAAKKTTAKKTATKRTAARATTARKSAAKTAAARTTAARTTAARTTAATRSAAKTAARTTAARTTAAKKAALARRAAAKQAAPQTAASKTATAGTTAAKTSAASSRGAIDAAERYENGTAQPPRSKSGAPTSGGQTSGRQTAAAASTTQTESAVATGRTKSAAAKAAPSSASGAPRATMTSRDSAAPAARREDPVADAISRARAEAEAEIEAFLARQPDAVGVAAAASGPPTQPTVPVFRSDLATPAGRNGDPPGPAAGAPAGTPPPRRRRREPLRAR